MRAVKDLMRGSVGEHEVDLGPRGDRVEDMELGVFWRGVVAVLVALVGECPVAELGGVGGRIDLFSFRLRAK